MIWYDIYQTGEVYKKAYVDDNGKTYEKELFWTELKSVQTVKKKKLLMNLQKRMTVFTVLIAIANHVEQKKEMKRLN